MHSLNNKKIGNFLHKDSFTLALLLAEFMIQYCPADENDGGPSIKFEDDRLWLYFDDVRYVPNQVRGICVSTLKVWQLEDLLNTITDNSIEGYEEEVVCECPVCAANKNNS